MIYRGYVKDGTIVLDEDVSLPDGTEVHVEPIPAPRRKTLAERFQNIIGAVDDLPTDVAENHDHYLYGTSKSP